MLIAQIPVLLSKLVQLRFQQHGQQANRALAGHGITIFHNLRANGG